MTKQTHHETAAAVDAIFPSRINPEYGPHEWSEGQTYGDIAREYFPGADDDLIEYVISGGTGFPAFWNIPEDGATPLQCFRTQLKRAADYLAEHGRFPNYDEELTKQMEEIYAAQSQGERDQLT